MDDEMRKLLMEYLGEEWGPYEVKEWQYITSDGAREFSAFPVEGGKLTYRQVHVKRLTFDTPADLHAILSAIVENGKWEDFCDYAFSKSPAGQSRYNAMEHAPINAPRLYLYDTKYIAWLFCLNAPAEIPERLKLVGEWLKGRG